jgi:hypothetical protein
MVHKQKQKISCLDDSKYDLSKSIVDACHSHDTDVVLTSNRLPMRQNSKHITLHTATNKDAIVI